MGERGIFAAFLGARAWAGMKNNNFGAGNGGRHGLYASDAHQRSVNAQSLHILQIIAELFQCYPETADVTEAQQKLQAESERSWRWLIDLGMVQGEPAEACLTASGKQVVDKANLNPSFQDIVLDGRELSEPSDRHTAAVLALLHANYVHRHVPKA